MFCTQMHLTFTGCMASFGSLGPSGAHGEFFPSGHGMGLRNNKRDKMLSYAKGKNPKEKLFQLPSQLTWARRTTWGGSGSRCDPFPHHLPLLDLGFGNSGHYCHAVTLGKGDMPGGHELMLQSSCGLLALPSLGHEPFPSTFPL